jgi:branched-chain amino acid transport system ATP-binding protein
VDSIHVDSRPFTVAVQGLVAGYGKKQVLNDVAIDVAEGEIVALIGHNGDPTFSEPVVSEALTRIQQVAQNNNVAVLIVEQKVREVLKIAHRVCVLRNGRVSFSGAADDLKDDAKLREVYL